MTSQKQKYLIGRRGNCKLNRVPFTLKETLKCDMIPEKTLQMLIGDISSNGIQSPNGHRANRLAH